MILFKKAAELRLHLEKTSGQGLQICFIPTMGALHNGHISLIRQGKSEGGLTVCSIFVNPTQFNDPADFANYPVTIDRDILLLEQNGCDILFLPSVEEMYPPGTPPRHYELGRLETLLEGRYRPGHFQGVCQAVDRLLDIVQPDILIMGRKDYQQCMVIQRLLDSGKRHTRLVIGATLREDSGLAMSSRNMRLSAGDREKATAIYHTLQWLQTQLQAGPLRALSTRATQMLLDAGFEKVDYCSICDAETLETVTEWDGHTKLVALTAAFLNPVRLIDNLALN